MLNARTNERRRWQEWGWLASRLAVAPLAVLDAFLAGQTPAAANEPDLTPSAVIEHPMEHAVEQLCTLDDEVVAFYWLPCG